MNGELMAIDFDKAASLQGHINPGQVVAFPSGKSSV